MDTASVICHGAPVPALRGMEDNSDNIALVLRRIHQTGTAEQDYEGVAATERIIAFDGQL
jgi:hypothetical protein